MQFVNIGYSNLLNAQRVISVVSPDAAPIKRLVQDAREKGFAIDATGGKKTKAVIITDSNHVVLSALTPDAINARLRGGDAYEEEEDGDDK